MCVTLCLALAENMLVYTGREVFFWVCYFVTLAHLVAHSVSRGEVIEVDTVNVFKRNFLFFFLELWKKYSNLFYYGLIHLAIMCTVFFIPHHVA